MVRIGAGLLVLALSGCALTMDANVHHNSRGTACLDTPIFSVIDLIIAGVTAAAVLHDEDTSRGYLAIPGVFAASGVLGTVSAIGCRGDSNGPAEAAPPASNSAPSFGDAPVDPEAREATREELGLEEVPTAPPALRLDRDGLPTSLPPAPVPPPTPVPSPTPSPEHAKPEEPAPLTCKLEPRVLCPDGYYCSLVAENTGVCVQIK